MINGSDDVPWSCFCYS